MARLAATSPFRATIWNAAMRIRSSLEAQAPSSRGRSPKRAISPKTSAAKTTKSDRHRRHGRRVAVAERIEDLDRQRLDGEAGDHVGDDIFVEREHEGEGVAGKDVGADERQDDRPQDGAVVGAHRRGRLDDLSVDRGEAEGQGHQRQRHEEDRVADHHRPRRAVEADRRPEGEEAERGDDRRQDEGREPQHLDRCAPRRAAGATGPDERKRDR